MASQLQGVRIWLSGSVPPDSTEAQISTILKFVQDFAAIVFRNGGYILHGSHPSFTPILVEEAKKFIQAGGHKDCLILVMSRFWSKDRKQDIDTLRESCTVYETPEAEGNNARDRSLSIMREWMVARCDSFVAVGGNWWNEIPGRAGVPIEADLALNKGLPCFLLGGLGGAAEDFIRKHTELTRSLRNGLGDEENKAIAVENDVASLVNKIFDQLGRLPLVHGRSDGISFRILALDGGGIKGAFSASVLATLEELTGQPIAKHFDLIAGTSTGGIIALGMGSELTTKAMLEFYRNRGTKIFPTSILQNAIRWLQHWFFVKHSLAKLREQLSPIYKEKVLSDSLCRLVIPAYDTISGACHIFRTPHDGLVKGDASTKFIDVALATAAAPTYFSATNVNNKISNTSYLDGGVWANSPVMAAIIEAVVYLNVPLDRIDVLSVGTTSEPFTVETFSHSGKLGWRKTLINLLMNAQIESTVNHARLLVGEPRFMRINAITPPGKYELDDATEVESLIALGNRQASNTSILSQVKSRFLNGIEAMQWK